MKKFEFPKPIKVGGKDCYLLQMREPTVQDMLDLEELKGTDLEKEMEMIGRLCGVCAEDLKPISVASYKKLQAGYVSFLGLAGQN